MWFLLGEVLDVRFETRIICAADGKASARAIVSSAGTITDAYIINAGIGYTATASLTFAAPGSAGVGTYQFNEIVVGASSSTTGRVKNWDKDTMVLQVGNADGVFYEGETIVGSTSAASYTIGDVPEGDNLTKYDQNSEIELEADSIIDFSESNPFGQV